MITLALRMDFELWMAEAYSQSMRTHTKIDPAAIADKLDSLARLALHEQDLRWLLSTAARWARDRQVALPSPAPAANWPERMLLHAEKIAQRTVERVQSKIARGTKGAKVSSQVSLPPEVILWLEAQAPINARSLLSAGILALVEQAKAGAGTPLADPFE